MYRKARKLFIVLGLSLLCGLFLSQAVLLAANRSAMDRVDEALQEGQINLKTAVLQKAGILFGSQISLQAKTDVEAIEQEGNRLGLFEDVRRVFDRLSRSDREYLSALSPELKQVIKEETKGIQRAAFLTTERPPSAIDRVSRAADKGEITLKEAVLTKAQLLFAPKVMTAGNPFSTQPGEVAVAEEGHTGFYKDVHRVFDELSEDEKVFLGSLSPDLSLIISTRERERSGAVGVPPVGALPNYPDLTETEVGKKCIIHYTLDPAKADAIPDKTYAQLIRLYMDSAIASNMVKNFTKAYAEGYADFAGKLHVYLTNMGLGSEWVDVSTVSGNQKAGYIKFTTKAKDQIADGWQVWVKGVLFHEYFHGIQSTYNYKSDIWFLEATAVWAQCYYGGFWMHVGTVYNDPGSIFNTPNDVIWSSGYRKYSTSALAFYLSQKYAGYKIIKSYFEKSVAKDDAIDLLKDTLAEKTTTFAEQYPIFLASLYSKKITSINKYMPDVKIETTHNAYGVKATTGTVSLTGANFYAMDPEAGKKPGTLFATFTAGATGSPVGILVKKSTNKPIPIKSPRTYVTGFGSGVRQVALIVTDTNYTTKDTAARTYEYTAIVPYIVITEVTADSPIQSGDYSTIDIYYDLTGTVPDEDFPVQMKVVEKGPDVADNASGEYPLPSGEGQLLNLYFNTVSDTKGTYRFTFELKVPANSWQPNPNVPTIPTVKSQGKCVVVVEPPPESPPLGVNRIGSEGKKPNLSLRK